MSNANPYVVLAEPEIAVECTSWLPSVDNSTTHPSIYRFSAGNSYPVLGYIRIDDRGSVGITAEEAAVLGVEAEDPVPASLTINWESLGSLTLNGASGVLKTRISMVSIFFISFFLSFK